GHFDRHRPDAHLDAEPMQRVHEQAVELGDRPRLERNAGLAAVRAADHELVVDEIEHDRQRPAAADRQPRRDQPARGNPQRDVPPMIGARRQRETDLADDLRPHVQRRVGVAPGGERKRRPAFEVGHNQKPTMTADPHRGQPIRRLGPDPAHARLVVVCVHGRGATAADILGVADELQLPDVAYVAPEAAGRTWYPQSFLAPLDANEPWLSSALGVLGDLAESLQAKGAADRIAVLGFSQGACLALEFAARFARRYAGVVAFSGGVIGPPGTPREYAGSMDGAPVFLGCSDVDQHIPLARVRESAAVFERLGARVDQRIYPRMGHTINADEIAVARELLGARR